MCVADTGQGIPIDHLERVFEPYFTTKAQGKGTGMGLAVVHGIVESHAGGIEVFSNAEQGTTSHVFFPRFDRSIRKDERPARSLPGGRESILLVDDEDDALDSTAEQLRALGYHIFKAQNGVAALEQFTRHPRQIDLVISDQHMPEMTGEQLAARIRDIRAGVPFILISAFGDAKQNLPKTTPVMAFLPKPILKDSMARTIRAILDGAPAAPARTDWRRRH